MGAVAALPRETAQAARATTAVELVRSREAFDALETEWRALEERSEGAIFFQSFDWCRNFLDHAAREGGCDMFIAVARERGKAVAILPMALQSLNGLKILTGLSEPFQQYTEMLADPQCDPQAAFLAMLPLIRSSRADCLHLGQVRRDGNLHRGITGTVPPSGEEDGAPYVPIGEYKDFAAFQQTVNAKTRKNMRNARNRLERDAPVTHDAVRCGEVLADAIDRSYHGREAWLERQGLTSRAFRKTDFGAFLDRFKQPENTGIDTIAFVLRHGLTPMADQWGFVHKRRYYAFMARWEEGYEEASPGKMQLGAILELCHGEGIDVADFLMPAARYKFTWARECVPVQDHVLALTIRGWIHNTLWLQWARPLAKKTLEAMPARLRGGILKVVMR